MIQEANGRAFNYIRIKLPKITLQSICAVNVTLTSTNFNFNFNFKWVIILEKKLKKKPNRTI